MAVSVSRVAPLRMKVKCDLMPFSVEFANLPLDVPNRRIRLKLVDLFEFRNLNKHNKSRIPLSKYCLECFSGVINQLFQRARAVTVHLIVQRKYALNHRQPAPKTAQKPLVSFLAKLESQLTIRQKRVTSSQHALVRVATFRGGCCDAAALVSVCSTDIASSIHACDHLMYEVRIVQKRSTR